MEAQSRSKISLYNSISAMLLTLINGLFGILVTQLVILQYGSDFNGLNSTVNQIVNVLLVLEGGFTVASNVALFSPLSKKDYDLTNGILSATKKKFQKIGTLFFVIGLIVSISYGFLVNSSLSKELIITMTMMTMIPASFNLYYATTYRVLLQAQQKEYIINLITTCTIGLGHVANIATIYLNGPMWMIRFNTMFFALINSISISRYVQKKNKFLDLNVLPNTNHIKGTNDVLAQKITGIIYNSAPIVFLSISPTGGTILASVYAVYNNIFSLLKNLLHGIIDAPRLGIGQLLTERKREDVWEVFCQYEYLAFSGIFILLSSCFVLILPFINIYTHGINDINYYDPLIALLMVLITLLEMIHIPSGHLLNMSGEFKVSRDFQVISCVMLIILMPIGGAFFGVYGMLSAILVVAFILAVLEMGYIHVYFFKNKIISLFKMLIPVIIFGIFFCFIETKINWQITGYISFFLEGIVLVALNSGVLIIVSFIFNKKIILSLINRLKIIINKKEK